MAVSYLYALLDPRPNHSTMYIGQSVNIAKRMTAHLGKNNATYCGRWLRKIRSAGLAPRLVILAKTSSACIDGLEEAAVARAWRLGFVLSNSMPGGKKPPNMKGIPKNAETRRRMSMAGRGRVFSDEHRAKISVANKRRAANGWHQTEKGLAALRLGRAIKRDKPNPPVSEETRLRMSKAQRGRKHPPEVCARIAAGNVGKVLSDFTRALIAEVRYANAKGYWAHWVGEVDGYWFGRKFIQHSYKTSRRVR